MVSFSSQSQFRNRDSRPLTVIETLVWNGLLHFPSSAGCPNLKKAKRVWSVSTLRFCPPPLLWSISAFSMFGVRGGARSFLCDWHCPRRASHSLDQADVYRQCSHWPVRCSSRHSCLHTTPPKSFSLQFSWCWDALFLYSLSSCLSQPLLKSVLLRLSCSGDSPPSRNPVWYDLWGKKKEMYIDLCPSSWHRPPKTLVISWVMGVIELSYTELLTPLKFPGDKNTFCSNETTHGRLLFGDWSLKGPRHD